MVELNNVSVNKNKDSQLYFLELNNQSVGRRLLSLLKQWALKLFERSRFAIMNETRDLIGAWKWNFPTF